MPIEIIYVCDNPLRTAPHYSIDQQNLIRVEQVIQGTVSRPMIFCSPECAAQYVDAWLQARVHLDSASIETVADITADENYEQPVTVDDEATSTAIADPSGEEDTISG